MTDLTAQRIEIPLSKSKLVLMLLGSFTFIAIGFWFIIVPPTPSNSFWGSSIKIAVVSYASILFFGICAFFIIRKIGNNKPGLIIDETGLIDNSSGVSIGRISWSEIEDIFVVEINRQKLIMLQVRNPEEHIARNSGFKRKMMQMNYKTYGSPLSITSNGLKISFKELHTILIKKLKASRKK
jgi:hypothetical protein